MNNRYEKNLVIVESPTKAKTISNYLGDMYKVMASMGHLVDLPENDLAVDIKNGFIPRYIVIKGREKILRQLQKEGKVSDKIYLASDPDREGEAIAWHIANRMGQDIQKFQRVLLYEITKDSVKKSFQMPQKIDQRKVYAQQARRILDRLVGYLVSPILWKTIRRGLSAGRVQTVALRMICEKEEEIAKFLPVEYWSIHADLLCKDRHSLKAKLIKIGEKFIAQNKEDIEQIENGKFDILNDKAKVEEICKELKKFDFVVKSMTSQEKKKNPYPPFITSTLQQTSSQKLNFSTKKTMRIAQQLYEGIEIGEEGSVGLITYMRTDSIRVSEEALESVRTFIKEKFGKQYLPAITRKYKIGKSAQDAHEAIRPTDVRREPKLLKSFLSEEQFKLYELIWKRFVASQMTSAFYDYISIEISAEKYTFKSTGSVLKFKGFLAVFSDEERKDEMEEDELLPVVSIDEKLELTELTHNQHFTQPPSRYNEGSLVKELEANGIGRPSTYANIVTTIEDRNYVVKIGRNFLPTELGKIVNNLLISEFPNLFDSRFTARMEEDLDNVEVGKSEWTNVVENFYRPFSKMLKNLEVKKLRIKQEIQTQTEILCERCGKKMIVKWGRHGKFLGCSGFPACKNTRPIENNLEKGEILGGFLIGDKVKIPGNSSVFTIVENDDPSLYKLLSEPGNSFFLGKKISLEKVGHEILISSKQKEEISSQLKCDFCGKPMILKNGTYGNFWACSGYPECTNTKPFSSGVKCPQKDCDGFLTKRRSKKRRIFYGCSRFPECNFVTWKKPVAGNCPQCGCESLGEIKKDFNTLFECLRCGNKINNDEVNA